MKALAALAFAVALTAPALAQSDPKVEFLGHCIAQGSSSTYCACMADTLSTALPGNDFVVYNDYLAMVAAGQQDPQALIGALTQKHGVTKKDLARILKAANATISDPKVCAGQ